MMPVTLPVVKNPLRIAVQPADTEYEREENMENNVDHGQMIKPATSGVDELPAVDI